MTDRNYESFIFTHIPKCGGTSFREYIFQAGLDSGIDEERMHVPGYGDVKVDENPVQMSERDIQTFRDRHKLILACHAHYNVHENFQLNLDNPYYYVIFREPVQRFVSLYDYFYRFLGMGGFKDISINDAPEDKLEELIINEANIQLAHLLDMDDPKGSEADDSWYNQAVYNLETHYAAFGVLEDMPASIKLLRATAPTWLTFADMKFPVTNQGKLKDKNAVDLQIVEKIRQYNSYDLKLHDYATRLLQKRLAELT